MKKMLGPISHIWKSLRRFFSSLTNRATKGTGIAVKTVGGAAATIMTVIAMTVLLIVIAIAAIPYGVFTNSDQQRQEVSANAPNIVDAEITEIHCIKCGIVSDAKTSLIKRGKHHYCHDCIDKEEANEKALEKS